MRRDFDKLVVHHVEDPNSSHRSASRRSIRNRLHGDTLDVVRRLIDTAEVSWHIDTVDTRAKSERDMSTNCKFFATDRLLPRMKRRATRDSCVASIACLIYSPRLAAMGALIGGGKSSDQNMQSCIRRVIRVLHSIALV
jgi:hypothetical protein